VKNNYLVLIVLCFLLTACGGEASRPYNYDPVPALVGFDIVDSYGVDTAKSNEALEVDPFIDDGIFEVFWRVNSLEDYEVNVRINSTPDSLNSMLIYSDVCGAGLSCDQGGNLICQYTPDYDLSCGHGAPRYIKSLPQNSYLILEVCDLDSSYCSYRYYPVFMR
jgi:hypothetical protein